MHGADAIAAAGVRSATSAAAPGRGALTFSRVGERTVVRRAFSTSPLKLLNPQNHGSAAWVYLASYGGGLVGGDALRSGHLHAGFDQGLSLAARREPALARRRCRQRDASPCARSDRLLRPISYAQEIEIRLAQHGVLVLVDWLVAGRVASGERWQLDRYGSVTQVWCGQRRLLYDSLRLTPEDGDVALRMGRFNTLLTAIVAGPPLAADAARILQEVAAMPLEKRADLLISASPLGEAALLLRIAAVSTERAGQTLRRMLAFLPPKLGDDPWSRKW